MVVSFTAPTSVTPTRAATSPLPTASATDRQETTPGSLPATTGTSAVTVASAREESILHGRTLDLGRDHLALHLFTSRNLATAQRLTVADGAAVTEVAASVAAAYSVDLTIDVSFLGDVAGQIDRLADLDPALLHDFAAAFHALDGSRATQKELFRATDALFDGLENELGLDATELDDEAAMIKEGVKGFFRQVRQFERLVRRAGDGAAQWVGQQLHRLAGESLRSVAESDAQAMQRLRQATEMLDKVGEDNLGGAGKRHLGKLFRKLLDATHRPHDKHGGDHHHDGHEVDTALSRATDHMVGRRNAADALRPPIHALDTALRQAGEVTASLAIELATQFEAAVRASTTTTAPNPSSPDPGSAAEAVPASEVAA